MDQEVERNKNITLLAPVMQRKWREFCLTKLQHSSFYNTPRFNMDFHIAVILWLPDFFTM